METEEEKYLNVRLTVDEAGSIGHCIFRDMLHNAQTTAMDKQEFVAVTEGRIVMMIKLTAFAHDLRTANDHAKDIMKALNKNIEERDGK